MKKKLLFGLLFGMFCLSGFAQATAYPVPDINQCQSEVFDLTVQTPIVLGNQSSSDFTVMYYLSWEDAENNVNPIVNPNAFIMNNGYPEQALYIRVTNTNDDTFAVTSFVVSHFGGPVIPDMPDVTVCDSYTLPALEIGNYYSGPFGTGTMIPAGTVVTTSQYIYIYATSGACGNEESFYVTVTSSGTIMADPLVECAIPGTSTASFNLEPLIGWVWQSVPGAVNVNVYETPMDAQMGTNAIPNINNYMSPVTGQVSVFVGAQTDAGCTWVIQVPLIVTECSGLTLSGHVAYDANGNGCDENDTDASGILVYYISGNYSNYAYTDNDGNYSFYNVPTGNVSVYADTFYPVNFVSSPESYPVVVGEEDITGVNFCLTPPAPVNDVAVSMYPVSAAQPGFMASYVLYINNFGNMPASGTVTLQFNDTQLDFVDAWPAMSQSGNTLTFSYSNLQPYGYQYIFLDFMVGMPGVVDLGDVISFNANVTLTGATDAHMDNNTYALDQVSVNSWDPNDINVREGEEISEEQADDYLHYVIRFQNTGNADAHNVKVLTTLDNNLDWTTFQPMGGSHDFQTNRSGSSGDVEFRFSNIELPGSQVNEPDSHGYIIYRIKPKNNIQVGEQMSAQAGIYFDFNPVITTNAITTTVMSTAGTKGFDANGFVMYPNPASSKITLGLKDIEGKANVTISDVTGKTVVKAEVEGAMPSVDVSALTPGVYFVMVNSGGKQTMQKLVKE